MKRIEIFENGIYLTFEISERKISLRHLSPFPYREGLSQTAAESGVLLSKHGLVFREFDDTSDLLGRRLVITQTDESGEVEAVTHFRFYTDIPVVRTWTEIICRDERSRIIATELPPMHDLVFTELSGVRIAYIGGTQAALFYMPEDENGAEPSVVIGAVKAGGGLSAFDNAAAALTRLRRAVKRRTPDQRRLPVIFCGGTEGSPETGYPLIDAAAKIGCEYFCIDAKGFVGDREAAVRYIRSKGMIAGDLKEIEVISDADGLITFAPEECAVRCCLSSEQGTEETVSAMVNAMLTRPILCGELSEINNKNRELIAEALRVYRKLRKDIPRAVPFFPTGQTDPVGEWNSFGLMTDSCAYIAVHRKAGAQDTITLPLGFIKGKIAAVECIYPSFAAESLELDASAGTLRVTFSTEHTARLFRISTQHTQ